MTEPVILISTAIFCVFVMYIVFGVFKSKDQKIKALLKENAELRQDLVKYQVFEENKDILSNWLAAHQAIEHAGSAMVRIEKIKQENLFVWEDR